MLTATLHLEEVGGFPGPARTYKLSEPKDFGTTRTDYVTVWFQKGFKFQDPEVGLVPATETGACAEPSMRRRPGSFVLHDNPETPEQIEGAYLYALWSLGVQEVR